MLGFTQRRGEKQTGHSLDGFKYGYEDYGFKVRERRQVLGRVRVVACDWSPRRLNSLVFRGGLHELVTRRRRYRGGRA